MSVIPPANTRASGTILLADDDKGIRRSLSLYLAKLGYTMLEAENGRDALELIDRGAPFLVLADLAMPHMGGMEILEYVRIQRPEVDVILMTGHVDARAAIDGIKAGAFDFLKKPFLLDELRVAVHRVRERQELLRLLQERERVSREHMLEVMVGLANIIDAKSQYTREHSDRVARYAKAFARFLQLPAERFVNISFGAKLHDIGKVGTPDHILNSTGPLSKADRLVIMDHPSAGAKILEPMWVIKDIVPMVRLHHENWDGSGYPDGLVGAETPMEARIVKIADYFDAITSIRPYREPMTHRDACGVLATEEGKQLDPELTRAFIGMIESDVLASPAMESAVLPAVTSGQR
jgi:putative two-component system response regulator